MLGEASLSFWTLTPFSKTKHLTSVTEMGDGALAMGYAVEHPQS